MTSLITSRMRAHLVPGANLDDPEWPTAYSFQAVKNGRFVSVLSNDVFDLEVGQKGYIVDFVKAPKADSFTRLRLKRYDPPGVGWVDGDHVQISSHTKQGQPPKLLMAAGNSANTRNAEWQRTTMPSKECGRTIGYHRIEPATVNTDGKLFSIGSIYTRQYFIAPSYVPVGTVCEIDIEICENGRPHPRPYARLPLIGPWDDWQRAMSFAIRLTFHDKDNNPQLTYLQKEFVIDLPSGIPDPWVGCCSGYVDGTAILRYFSRQTIDRAILMPGDKDLGLVHYRDASFDCFTNTIIVSDIITKSEAAKPRQLIPDNVIVQRMVNAGLQNVGRKPSNVTMLASQGFSPGRKRCDYCMLLAMMHLDDRIYCNEIPNSSQCNTCSWLRRPCSFTPGCEYGASKQEHRKKGADYQATMQRVAPWAKALLYQPLDGRVEALSENGKITSQT